MEDPHEKLKKELEEKNDRLKKNRKLSDEAERLFYDYTNKQSEYYAILFSDNFNEKKRSK